MFGSSETGGIAHRQQDDALWTPFANVDIQATEQQELQVKANHAFSADWILTGDKVELEGKYVPHFKPGKELRDRANIYEE